MTPATIISVRPTPGARRAAWLVAGALLILGTAAIPFASRPWPAIDWYVPVICTAAVLVNLMTCYVLFGQFLVSGSYASAILGGGYLYSAVIVGFYLISFPGSGTLVAADPQASGWLWIAWHAGFPLIAIAYALAERRKLRRANSSWLFAPAIAAAAAVAAASIGLGALLLNAGDRLPPLIDGLDYSGAVLTSVGLGTLAANFAALAAVLVLLRSRTLLQLWLPVATLAFALSTVLIAVARQRYALGWYLAPAISLAGAGAVLLAFLHEMTLLYAKLVAMQARLRAMVDIDGLTGLANRRRFNTTLQQQWLHARREQRPISLLMIDVDHFKAYNDGLGHPAGDRCLQRLAAAIAGALHRPIDLAARYGGEEFAVILPETDPAGARRVAEHIQKAIHDLRLPQPAEPGAYVHVSIGVATDLEPFGESEAALVVRSDAALYRAKHEGRNRIVCADVPAAKPNADRRPLALAS